MIDKTTEKQLGGCTGKGFKPGQSGNPNGRPKDSISFTTEIKRKLREIPKGEKRSYLEEVILVIIEKAKKGDERMLRLIWNYVDGMPRQNIGLDGGEEGRPIPILIKKDEIYRDDSDQEDIETEEEDQSDPGGGRSE